MIFLFRAQKKQEVKIMAPSATMTDILLDAVMMAKCNIPWKNDVLQ